MSQHSPLRKHRGLLAAAGILLMLIAAANLVIQYWPEAEAQTDQTFYTIDDGNSWFADSVYRIAPFEHNGSEAVMAYVYNYDNGSKEFVGYLGKYTPEAKERLEAAIETARAEGRSPSTVQLFADPSFMRSAIVIKKPGETEWVPLHSPEGRRVQSVVAPDGSEVDSVYVY